MSNAAPKLQSIAVWNAILGMWARPHLDLFGLQEPCSRTWWTSGMTRNGPVYPLPPSAHHIPDIVYSSSRTALLRTPLASDASRGGESLQKVKARRRTIALSHQIIDLALHGPDGYPKPDGLWRLSISQQLAALGNGVLPRQAAASIRGLSHALSFQSSPDQA